MTKPKSIAIGGMRECAVDGCEAQIPATPNRLYCDTCKLKIKRDSAKHHSSQTWIHRKEIAAAKKRQSAEKKVIVTADEQKAIDRAIDNKYCVDQTVHHYTPGHPRFKELCRQYGCHI